MKWEKNWTKNYAVILSQTKDVKMFYPGKQGRLKKKKKKKKKKSFSKSKHLKFS